MITNASPNVSLCGELGQSAQGSGFHLTFENGWTVSVQFGRHNYCARRDGTDAKDQTSPHMISSEDAEIAAWDAKGVWYRGEDWNDDVRGWVKPDEIATFIAKVALFPR